MGVLSFSAMTSAGISVSIWIGKFATLIPTLAKCIANGVLDVRGSPIIMRSASCTVSKLAPLSWSMVYSIACTLLKYSLSVLCVNPTLRDGCKPILDCIACSRGCIIFTTVIPFSAALDSINSANCGFTMVYIMIAFSSTARSIIWIT